MYAIIETGGKQYKVGQGDMIFTERFPKSEKGQMVQLDKVLLAHDGKKVRIGTPYLTGAKVICELLGEEKGEKLIDFQYRRREGYRRKVGHRQTLARLRVKELVF